MMVRVKNRENRFRTGLAVFLATIAGLTILEKYAGLVLVNSMVFDPYAVMNIAAFQFLCQVLLIVVGIIMTWSIIAFVTGQLKEIKDRQVEWKPRADCREYPLAGSLIHENTPLNEVVAQWNATRDYAANHPEDKEHWFGRMQQIIARCSWQLRQHFNNLTNAELEKEHQFAEENLAGARVRRDTEARIRWNAVIDWIDDAMSLEKEGERREISTTRAKNEQNPGV